MNYENQFYKYVIIDDQAYTKEKVLIYTILVKTENDEITLEDIMKYFENFGQVLNVRLLQKYNFSIKFADSKDAAKVLQHTEHTISNHEIFVEPDSCWHQRGIEGFVKYIQREEDHAVTDSNNFSETFVNDDVEEEGALILKLNDLCLECICEKLSIPDQINFALSCQRFCNILEMFSRIKYTNINMKQGFAEVNSFQINVFGLIVGPYIESLSYNFESSSLAKLLGIYCTNLKTLRIYSVPMSLYILGTHAKHMPMLKTLELVDVELMDRMMHYIAKFKNLKYLSLAGNRISGVTLSSLVKLKGLCLNRCMFIKSNNFLDICQNLKNLKYLDIRYCHDLGTKDFQCILENLVQLEILKFTINDNNFICFASLPKLKNLEINTFLKTDISLEFLKELVKHQVQQMENLKLYSIFNINYEKFAVIAELRNLKVFWCCHNLGLDDKCLEKLAQLKELEDVNLLSNENITDEGVLKILKNCLKLKKLHLVHCEGLTSDFIRKAFNLLQDQHNKWLRTHLLHITVEDENSFRDVINELDLYKPNTILKISLESSRNGCVYRSPEFPEGLDKLEDEDEYEGNVNDDIINDVNDDVNDVNDDVR